MQCNTLSSNATAEHGLRAWWGVQEAEGDALVGSAERMGATEGADDSSERRRGQVTPVECNSDGEVLG